MNRIKKIKSTSSDKEQFENFLEDVQIEDQIPVFEIPICLISIDYQKIPHLIKIINEEKTNPEIIEIIKEELSEYTLVEVPGVYVTNISVRSFVSYNAEISDCNFELDFINMRKIYIKL